MTKTIVVDGKFAFDKDELLNHEEIDQIKASLDAIDPAFMNQDPDEDLERGIKFLKRSKVDEPIRESRAQRRARQRRQKKGRL